MEPLSTTITDVPTMIFTDASDGGWQINTSFFAGRLCDAKLRDLKSGAIQ
jgi:N12 class adenine-specific DNA methylase